MRIAVTAFVLFLSSISLASFANAETIECATGDVQCLIAAIHQANADPHKTVIRLAAGTYLLTTADNVIGLFNADGLPLITSPVTIEGDRSGTTLARATDGPLFRFFHVGVTGQLTLDGLTLTNGGGSALFAYGGAIWNDHGTLTIIDTTIVSSKAYGGGGLFNSSGTVTITRTIFEDNIGASIAGALYSEESQMRISQSLIVDNESMTYGGVWVHNGTATIERTTFARNLADGAGALGITGNATVSIRDSAFSENRAPVSGAAAIDNSGTLDVINTTFTRNVVGVSSNSIVTNWGAMSVVNATFAENRPSNVGFVAPAILSHSTTTFLQNTIIVHDVQQPGYGCSGVVTSLGNNLIGDPTGCTITLQLTDFVGEANLGALTDDGTPGNAHYPLLPESRAIDSANDEACPKKDQIGQPRQPRCDIGAVEFPSFGVAAP
jgi:hypothetical protein